MSLDTLEKSEAPSNFDDWSKSVAKSLDEMSAEDKKLLPRRFADSLGSSKPQLNPKPSLYNKGEYQSECYQDSIAFPYLAQASLYFDSYRVGRDTDPSQITLIGVSVFVYQPDLPQKLTTYWFTSSNPGIDGHLSPIEVIEQLGLESCQLIGLELNEYSESWSLLREYRKVLPDGEWLHLD